MEPAQQHITRQQGKPSTRQQKQPHHHQEQQRRPAERGHVTFSQHVTLRYVFCTSDYSHLLQQHLFANTSSSNNPTSMAAAQQLRSQLQAKDPFWFNNREVDKMKAHAKNLSLLHCINLLCEETSSGSGSSTTSSEEDSSSSVAASSLLPLHNGRNSTSSSSSTMGNEKITNNNLEEKSIAHAARYEINGESLRGMEHITELSYGCKRRKIKKAALHAIMYEQQRQYEEYEMGKSLISSESTASAAGRSASSSSYLGASSSSSSSSLSSSSCSSNKRKLALVYKTPSQEALLHARHMAHEDASIALDILQEDLPNSIICNRIYHTMCPGSYRQSCNGETSRTAESSSENEAEGISASENTKCKCGRLRLRIEKIAPVRK